MNFRDWEIQMPGIDCDILMDTCDFLIHDRITGRNLSIRQAGYAGQKASMLWSRDMAMGGQRGYG